MKKAKCIVLVVLLILQVTTVAFAGNNFESNPLITLDIPLSFQPNDIKVMNDNWSEEIAKELSSSGFILKRDATNGLLTINFSKISTKQDNLIVSGNVIINLGEYSKNLNFSNTTLDLIKVSETNELYAGIIECYIEIKERQIPVLIDLVTDTSFEEKIATVSIGTLEKENMILFFGTNFAQYDEYVTSVFNHSIIEKQDTEDKGNNVSERSSEEKYVHCGYATNKKVGSNTASGETVIMTAAKRDFNDRDAYTGFEIVRVFSRSNKARAAVSGASSAVPYKAIMTFECTTPDYLEIVNTYPSPSNISLPSFIGIYSTLNGGIAFAEIFTNEILNLISSVSRSFDSTNNTPENNYSEVTITIDSTNAYDTDLPSSESAASAKSNDENGVLCKFKYDSMGNDSISSGSVDVSGRIQYRIYIGSSHRISTLTTGYATLTHSIINR